MQDTVYILEVDELHYCLKNFWPDWSALLNMTVNRDIVLCPETA